MKIPRLKRCPNCKGKARAFGDWFAFGDTKPRRSGIWRIECINCGLAIEKTYLGNAAKAWNRRKKE